MYLFGLKLIAMKSLHVVSRTSIYLLAIVLFGFGIFHFLYPRDLLIYVPQFLPGGIVWVYFVGGAFILVALSFLTNNLVKAAGYVLAILLAVFILSIHIPNYLHAGDKDMRQLALINLLKDTAIACFAMYIAAGAHHQHLHLEESD
jgi:putative oxidoreductase